MSAEVRELAARLGLLRDCPILHREPEPCPICEDGSGKRLPTLEEVLDALVERGISPDLHHTPIRPEYAAQEDPNDPEPRWCCHDQSNTMTHAHGNTPEEAVYGLLRVGEHTGGQHD